MDSVWVLSSWRLCWIPMIRRHSQVDLQSLPWRQQMALVGTNGWTGCWVDALVTFFWEFLHQKASWFLGYSSMCVCVPWHLKSLILVGKTLHDDNKQSWKYSAKLGSNLDGLQKTWNDDMTLASCSSHQISIMKEHFKLLTPRCISDVHTRSHKTSKMFSLVYQNLVSMFPKNPRIIYTICIYIYIFFLCMLSVQLNWIRNGLSPVQLRRTQAWLPRSGDVPSSWGSSETRLQEGRFFRLNFCYWYERFQLFSGSQEWWLRYNKMASI